MDLGTTVIGAIFLAFCVVPFVLITQGGKKIEKQLLKKLIALASTKNCTIHKHEVCGELAIGIDNQKKVVFFHNKTQGADIEKTIDLSEIEKCTVLNTSKTIKNKNSSHKAIQKLELVFHPSNKKKPEIALTFFDIEDSSQLSGELQMTEDWSKHLNSLLTV